MVPKCSGQDRANWIHHLIFLALSQMVQGNARLSWHRSAWTGLYMNWLCSYGNGCHIRTKTAAGCWWCWLCLSSMLTVSGGLGSVHELLKYCIGYMWFGLISVDCRFLTLLVGRYLWWTGSFPAMTYFATTIPEEYSYFSPLQYWEHQLRTGNSHCLETLFLEFTWK